MWRRTGVSRRAVATVDSRPATVKNAVHAAEIAKNHGFRSVILITTDWHMPRSWCLLKARLAGSGVTVLRYAARRGNDPEQGWWSSRSTRGDVFRELLEFWGSLAEYGYHLLTGRLLREG